MHLTGSEFYKLLQTRPQSVTWSDPRSLTLKKTPSGSLGLKISAFHAPHESSSQLESTTVVYKIQPECTIHNSSLLANFDRIVSVDGKDIVNRSRKDIYSLFAAHTKDTITLGICRVAQLPSLISPASKDEVDNKLGQSPLGQIATNNTIQRHCSRGSSDSGRGSSPRSGDTGGCFDFTSTNSSPRSSGHSVDDTIASSSQTVSAKRSASGSSSTCSQVCSQPGQRKNLSCEHQYLGQSDNPSDSGSCSLCLSQHTICAPLVTPLPCSEQHCCAALRVDAINGGSSVPTGFSLSELHLLASRERTHSLPLPSEMTSPHLGRTKTCHCQMHDTVNNLTSDMAFEARPMSYTCSCNKPVSGSKTCSPKPLLKNSREQKASGSYCMSIAQQILNHPENVKWDPNTKVVTLEQNSKKTPGITLKFKHHRNKDGMVDSYNLVEQVEKGGLADGKLMVGDWIRSIDGNPADQNETHRIRQLLENQASVRFVIQRPVDLRGWNVTRDGKSRKPCNYTPSTSTPGVHQQLESSTGCGACSFQNLGNAVSPRHAEPSKMPPKMERYFSTVSHSSNGSGRHHSPRTLPVCTCANIGSHSYLRSVSTVCEPSDWMCIARNLSSMEENVKFPSLQLFIAGSHALKMTELLFNSNNQPTYAMGKEKFHHIRCYVSEEAYGVTKLYLHDDSTVVENDVLNGVISQCFDTQISVCEDDIELDVSTQVGCGPQSRCYSRLTSRSQNSNSCSIALDIFAVTDEKFFTHCCHFMFCKNSLFFLTFDGAKVLESTSELTKIGQMVHATRAASGADTPLFLYGFLDGDSAEKDSPKADELKALLYTDHGRQILRYTNVAMPRFIVLQPPVGVAVEDQGYEARQLLGQIVLHQEHLSGHVHLTTIPVMSWVLQQRDGCSVIQLGQLKDAIKTLVPEVQESQLTKIVQELQLSGMIKVTSADTTCNSGPDQQLVLLKPTCLLQCLQTLLLGLDRLAASSRASPRKSTGIKFPTAASDKMLKAASQISNSSRIAFNEMILFLEKFSVVLNVWLAPDTYLLPYFFPECQTSGKEADHKNELVLYMELERVISTGVFFRIVNSLAKNCQASELSSVTLYSASLTLDDWIVSLQHLWRDDLIKFSLRSAKVNLPNTPPEGFVNCVIQVCENALPNSAQFHLCVPCPLGEDCQTEKGRQPHLVDIQQDPNFCGNVRIDNKKTVKMWLSTLSTKMQLSKLSCHGDIDPPEDPPSPEEKRFDWSMPVLVLPYSLLHNLFLQLRIPMPRGNDWTGFAGCIGKTGLEVALYETQKNPPQDLITEWARMKRATVRDLVDVLSQPDMERVDLVDMVKQALNLE